MKNPLTPVPSAPPPSRCCGLAEKTCLLDSKTDLDRVTLKNETLRKYFPKSYTPKQMEDTIIKLLEGWYKKRQLSQER